MRRIRHLVVGAATVVAAIAIGDGAPTGADHGIRTAATTLTGAAEVPGPGDADGIGAAGILVTQAKVCYILAVKNIATATMAHIHKGSVEEAGDIVVHLDPPIRGFSGGCVRVDPKLAGAIATDPGQYYVNVHNAEFPSGAIRGQLG